MFGPSEQKDFNRAMTFFFLVYGLGIMSAGYVLASAAIWILKHISIHWS